MPDLVVRVERGRQPVRLFTQFSEVLSVAHLCKVLQTYSGCRSGSSKSRQTGLGTRNSLRATRCAGCEGSDGCTYLGEHMDAM